MKLLKSAVFSMMLATIFTLGISAVKAETVVWPTSVVPYVFPGQSDTDWKITFNIYPNYSPDPQYFRIYGKHFLGYWKEITDNGQWCRADFVSITPKNGGYEIVYMMGSGRAAWVTCLNQVTLDVDEVYMTYP